MTVRFGRATAPFVLVLTLGAVIAACDQIAAPLPSLKDQPGTFRVVTDAPNSSFGPAGTASGTGGAVPESTFASSEAEAGAFRLAEVPADRLAETRTLLTELGAKQDADQTIRFSLPADVLFDFDKASLRPDAQKPLAQAQTLIASYPKAPVTITGHTDAKGDDAYNERLSLARAKTVAARLAASGDRKPQVNGVGERDPVAPNTHADGSDDPAGRQRNRRVEIVLAPIPTATGN
ncbi:OmpA family protein [Sphingomonas aliaeris]|uniref:OmpA family protein n=1 Tax=Sphingomonas aliaeris TaxID=2759526 RepID=A0A974S4A1_9SPHN|nr:OmpA family protein [Sphingomonas aliaeris]QQV77413.1 OmpA family protein [Sphingomonas aliaeris]